MHPPHQWATFVFRWGFFIFQFFNCKHKAHTPSRIYRSCTFQTNSFRLGLHPTYSKLSHAIRTLLGVMGLNRLVREHGLVRRFRSITEAYPTRRNGSFLLVKLLKRHDSYTCSTPGRSLRYNDRVSTCSGTNLNPISGIWSSSFSTDKQSLSCFGSSETSKGLVHEQTMPKQSVLTLTRRQGIGIFESYSR